MSELPDNDRTLRYYWELLARRHWLLAAVFAGVALLVFAVGSRSTPVYQSTATLLVSQEGAAQDPLYLFSAAAGGLTKRPVLVNHIEVLKSCTIARMVFDALPADAQTEVRRVGPDPALAVQDALTARPVRDADIIQLSIRTGSARLARDICRAYVSSYRAFNLNRSRADVSAIKEFVGGQLAVVGARLDSAERRLEEYKQAHSIADLSEETRATVDRQTQVLALYEQTRAQRQGIEQELDYVSARLDSAGRGAGVALDNTASPLVTNLRSELARVESERTGLLVSGYAATSSRVRALDERVGQLKTRLGAELGRFAAGDAAGLIPELRSRSVELEPERLRLRAAEAALAGVVETYDGALRSLPTRERSLARLSRDVEADRQVHMLLAQRFEEARIQEAGRLSSVAVIDPAEDGVRVRPNHRTNAVLAVLLGLVLAFATVVAADYLDTLVRRPEDLERQGVSVLASVPRFVEGSAPGAVEGPAGPLAARNPGAPAVEAFRVLRTNLQFAWTAAGPDPGARPRLRTLLVTSPGAGEGKSTVASNLAIVFAQAGRRTLLIDADLRRPRQHAIFGGRRKPGLTDVAILGTPLDTGLHRIAPATADPSGSGPARLDALFAGTAPPSPVDFLNSTTLGALLDRLVDGYDCVIIDTPPVLVSADAVVLAARVDGVVIVARMGRTDWRALTEARRLLGQAGARVLGTVANELSVARGYGYARYRYHRYHYGYQHAAAH